MRNKFQIAIVSITTVVFVMLMFIPTRSYSSTSLLPNHRDITAVKGENSPLPFKQDDTLRRKALLADSLRRDSLQIEIEQLKKVIAKIDSTKNEVGTDTLKINRQIDSIKIVITEIESSINITNILSEGQKIDSLNLADPPEEIGRASCRERV